MDYRAQLHESDLKDVSQYGEYLNKPSNQLVRLVSLFDARQRVAFVKDAHCFLEGECPTSSLLQFAAGYILDAYVSELSPFHPDWSRLGDLVISVALRGPQTLHVSRLPLHLRDRASGVVSGVNYGDIALILANTLLTYDFTRNEELTRLLARTLRLSVLTAAQAAAVASAIEFNNSDIQRFENTARYLIDETALLPDACFSSRWDREALDAEAAILQGIVKEGGEARTAALQEQRELAALDELCRNHRLVPGPTGIFVPLRNHILVARSIAEAQRLAQDGRDLLPAMSPREFEQFIANIFHDLGFEVELTKATRDGGADLVCMRNLHGIPIRLAVEVKRYRARPVDVSLVRSFVGANEQWQANRLLYVTTSRYTGSAHEFADGYASHILTLRDYDQIAEWCSEVRRQQILLL